LSTTAGNPTILIGIVFLLFVWLVVLSIQLSVIRRRYRVVNEAAKRGNLAGTINQCVKDIDEIETQLKEAKLYQEQTWNQLQGVIQRVGMVRFDAFGDAGGNLSFAAAMLNESGDGLIVSSINGRQESRCYAKPVKGGQSSYTLSREEKEAIAKAMSGRFSRQGKERLFGE